MHSARLLLFTLAPALLILSVPAAGQEAPAVPSLPVPAVYEITLASLILAGEGIKSGDAEAAARHAEIASEFFTRDQSIVRRDDAAGQIHVLLADINTLIPLGQLDRAERAIDSAVRLVQDSLPDATPGDHVEMLAVAERYYREGAIYGDEVSHRTAVHLVARVGELAPDPHIAGILERMEAREADYAGLADSVAYAQRTLFGAASVDVDDSYLYLTIRSLYDSALGAVGGGDYETADEMAVEAYLDNFEYLEAGIAAADEDLMLALETAMRERLRGLIADRAPEAEIRAHIEGSILPDLARAEEIAVEVESEGVVSSVLAEPGLTLPRGSASEQQKTTVRGEIDLIREKLVASADAHEAGDYDASYESARSAYLDSYELIEIPLRAISPDFTLEVEYEFAELRNLVRGPADRGEVRSAIVAIERSLDESELLVTGTGELAPAIAFGSSFAIIFREGLESVLILGAILTYLEASRNTRFKPHIFYGVIGGIAATGVTWLVAQYIIDISGASRELIEAIAALSATAVLFYVSFWVLNKIEHKKWMEFVKAKVWQATTTGSATVFVMLSFFTIYREGFETVLFYQAMISFAKYSESFVILGLILGLASLLAVYYGMRKLGRRLPLRALFGLTMGVGAYLSVAFLGNGIRELQILDIVPYTSMLGTIPRLDINLATMTGIYPTLETTLAQIVLLSVYLIAASYVLVARPRRAARLAAMRKSRGDAQ